MQAQRAAKVEALRKKRAPAHLVARNRRKDAKPVAEGEKVAWCAGMRIIAYSTKEQSLIREMVRRCIAHRLMWDAMFVRMKKKLPTYVYSRLVALLKRIVNKFIHPRLSHMKAYLLQANIMQHHDEMHTLRDTDYDNI